LNSEAVNQPQRHTNKPFRPPWSNRYDAARA